MMELDGIDIKEILNGFKELIVYLDTDKRIVYANKAACNYVGKTLTEIRGKKCYEVWWNQSPRVCEECPIEYVLEKGESNFGIVSPGGRKSWYIKGHPVFGAEGRLVGVVLILESISDMTETERKYKLLIENIEDGVIVSQQNRVIYSNSKFAEMIGYKFEEMADFDLRKVYTPEGIKKIIERHNKRWKGEYVPGRYETTFKRKDGSIVPVEISVSIIEYGGKPATFAVIRDISHRKEVEKRIKEVYSITENAPVAIATFNKNFIVTYVNRFFTRLYGYKPEDIVGKPIYLLSGEENPREYFVRVVKSVKGNRVYRGNDLRRRKNGKVFWASVSVNKIVGEDGEFLFFTDNSRDISEEKAAVDRLKESEERYRSVVEYSHEGIVIIDNQFRIVFANSAVEKLTGYRIQEIVGNDFRDFLSKKSLSMTTRYYKLRQKGVSVPVKYTIEVICKDGCIKLFDLSSTTFKDSNGKVYSIAHLLDVTEKEEAEKRIQLLTSQIEKFSRISADILTIEDEEELFKRICRAIVEISDFNRVLIFVFIPEHPFKRVLGYHGYSEKEVEQFLNMGAGFRKENCLGIFEKGIQLGEQSCYLPRTMKYILKSVEADLIGNEYPGCGDLWHKEKEDSLFIALKNKKGDVIGLISLGVAGNEVVPSDEVVKPLEIFANHISQIIQLRQMEEERERVQRFLAESEKMRALGEVASGVAHDFNNLLSTILGRTQLLLSKVDDDMVRDDLKIIEKAALDGTETVKRIQNFTKLKGEVGGAPVDVAEVVEDSIIFTKGRWKDEAHRTGKKITFHTSYDRGYLIRGREGELREVFTNILFNAIDAMSAGGDIYVNIRPLGRFVEVSIKDTGVGMDKETLNRVFEPFFTTKEEGTGLGLSMVYGIVKNHGGDVLVESEPGKGTEVKVRLPMAEEESIRDEGGDKQRVQEEKPSLPVLDILVVDDEEGPRNVLRDLLSIYGMNVTVASSGQEGLDIFKKKKGISLVFTDLGMPGMSGWDLAREIKNMNSEVKIVLVTGWGVDLGSEKESSEKVVDEVIAKPFDIEKIVNVIRKLF